MWKYCAALALALAGAALPAAADSGEYHAGEARWWKGNTHTHSWWSDGDSAPEVIAAWYKAHGYHFLVLSDHNVMQQGKRWYPIDSERKAQALATYREQFGEDWVISREVAGQTQVKLKTLDEFRALFSEPQRFIFVRGEEITDHFHRHPVHLNGVNIDEIIEPRGGASVAETIQNNMNAVFDRSARTGRPMIAHLNHPNFHYAITPEDLFHLEHEAGEGFVEIYNGHPGVDNYGDAHHPSAERLWDIVLAKRLGALNASPVYGVATDDAHEYTRWGVGETNPGRGWVMVRARRLTPDSITAAMKRGDFYNSTGVTLRELTFGEDRLQLAVEAEPGVEYTVEFIGTREDVNLAGSPREGVDAPGRHGRRYSERIGEVLKTVRGTEASYRLQGDELYVRARVTSSKPHPNPYQEGDVEMAWTQPLVPGMASTNPHGSGAGHRY